MRIPTFLLAAITAFVLSGPGRAQTFSAAEIARIDAIAEEALRDSGAPSVSIAIVRGGEVAFARAYGLRDLQGGARATPASRYYIGSISKQFTAAAILMLAGEGRLSLDHPISRFLPGVTGGERITLLQLLSHTAGVSSYFTGDSTPAEGRRPIEPSAIAARWGGAPLDFEPGSRWSYSNTGYTLSGLIVERLSNRRLAAFLQARVFDPLNMRSAGDVDVRPLGPGDTSGHSRFALGPPRPAGTVGAGWLFAAGGLAMTASDLARWDIALLERRLLSGAGWDALQTEVKLNDGSGSGYGLGVYVDAVRGHRRVRHDGYIDGFAAENRVFPDDRVAIVVLFNADFASPVSLADRVEAMIFPPPATPAAPAAAPAADPAHAPVPAAADPAAAAELALARDLYAQVRDGRLDRSRLTADANAYFTPTATADYAASLSPLGDPPQFIQRRRDVIGGLNASLYELVWPDRKLIAILRLTPEGNVDSFVVFPA